VPGFRPELVASLSEGAQGNPTGHMMEAAFAHHRIDARYVNIEVAADDLANAVRGARAMGFLGFNLSMPHKVSVIAHLDALGSSAAAIGGEEGQSSQCAGWCDCMSEITHAPGS
jgi:shikimate dehydrogenase